MARPTKLTPALTELTREYINDCTKFEDVVPTTAGLSLALKVSRSTLYDWSNPKGERFNAEFSDMLDELQAKQERELVANGLQSIWNPAITKLMMAKHDYTDKVDHTSKGEKLPTPIYGGASIQIPRHDGN